jgi:hypothetical protein
MLDKPAYTVFGKQSYRLKANFEIIVGKWI